MKNRMAIAVSSVLYIGFIPGAPGTYGSIAAALAFYLVSWRFGAVTPSLHLAAVGGITIVGVIASSIASRARGDKDPSFVVIDEVAGQLVAFLFLPFTIMNILLGTITFRLFDIWKPYPIKKIESFGKGVGIMGDDLLAGVYANLVLQLITFFFHSPGQP